MWSYFFIFTALYLVLLYVPGFIACRCLGFRFDLAFCVGPIVGIACYSMLFIGFGAIGFGSSLGVCFFAFFALTLALYAARRHFFGLDDFDGGVSLSSKQFIRIGLAYVAIALVLFFVLFYRRFQDPSFMIQGFDTLFHVNLVRSFFDSQNFSSLTASLYQCGLSPLSQSSGGFYPAAWHGLCALALSINPEELNVAANALNYVFASVVFPSGVFLLLTQLFKKNEGLSCYLTGAFICPCLYAFPWAMLLRGEQFPQFSSFSLLPLVVSVIIMTIDAKDRRSRLAFSIVSLFGCLSLVLLQTSSIFAAYVFAAAYLLHYIYDRNRVNNRQFAIGLVCVVMVALSLFWIICFNVPFLRSVVEFEWPSTTDVYGAAFDTALFSFSSNAPIEPLLAILFLIGLIDIVKNRKEIYLVLPWVFFAISYISSASSDGTLIKHILGGFWYTDPSRLGALVCIAAVPVLCVGANYIVCKLAKLIHWDYVCSLGVGLMLCIAVIMFGFPWLSGVSAASFNSALCADIDRQIGSNDAGIYSAKEKAFVNRVLEEVDDSSVIVNCPDDGSAFMYADDDANILYRRNYADEDNELAESKIIRHDLNNLATDQSVQLVVNKWNIRYVLLLSSPEGEGAFHTYKLDDWAGLQLIDEATEGFRLIDREGDMRLYEIVD